MLIQTLKLLFNRDLNQLKTEIEQYKDEQNLWKIKDGILNSAGNLCLHLVGNLNTYIGATLGATNYVRNREQEFSLKEIPRAVLISQIEETILIVEESLNKISQADLEAEYPLLVLQEKTSTTYFLVHLTTHLAYHLGQVNYHRRLVDF